MTWSTSTSRRSRGACRASQPFAEVESTKSVSDVYSPVTGTITERNPLIDDRPELVNEQPYGDGWLVVLEPDDVAAVEALLDAAAYRTFVDEGSGISPSTQGRPSPSSRVEGRRVLRLKVVCPAVTSGVRRTRETDARPRPSASLPSRGPDGVLYPMQTSKPRRRAILCELRGSTTRRPHGVLEAGRVRR